MKILGVSAYYHDSAACLIADGEIVAAAQEERFTRKRHDASFPIQSIAYCLKEAGIKLGEVDAVAYYEKPFIKFERLIETYMAFAPRGFGSFLTSMPQWIQDKLFLRQRLREELTKLGDGSKLPELLFPAHHHSHAASTFYPSPFSRAAILCLDGVGEWTTTSAWVGDGASLQPLWDIRFPDSLGLLYSAFTYYTGFKVNSGEYKVMGLAPYGRPIYVQKILDHLIDIKPDGTFRLNMSYFDYCTGLKMTNTRFNTLFGGPPRQPEAKLTQKEMDLAASIQAVTEDVMLKLCASLFAETGEENLCLAGGVALNCVANGRVLREGKFKNLWIQPAAGDAGGALGAAFAAWHGHFQRPRVQHPQHAAKNSHSDIRKDAMKGAFLGPSFSDAEIRTFLEQESVVFTQTSQAEMLQTVATRLSEEKVVGWFQGRMEFGPRSLGARSILGDPRSPKMQSVMNLKIKYRESFRPFAPAVLRERASDYFNLDCDSPYMLLVAPIRESRRIPMTDYDLGLWGIDLLNVPRSEIPAVTHIDFSARVQTVDAATNPAFHGLLKEFERITGCPVLVNTSFNVRGEPIVCTPHDAFRCFMRTEIDVLVLVDFVIEKSQQTTDFNARYAAKNAKDENWRQEFALD